MEISQLPKSIGFFSAYVFAVGILSLSGCGKSEFQSAPDASTGIDPSLSRIVVPSTSVLADGLTPAPILIQLRDSKGRGVQGISLTLVSTGSGNTITACPKTDSAGNSQCQMVSTVPEMKSLRTMGKITLGAKILFELPTPSAILFSIVSSGDLQSLATGHRVITAVGTVTTQVDLRDSFAIKRFRSSHLGTLPPME